MEKQFIGLLAMFVIYGVSKGSELKANDNKDDKNKQNDKRYLEADMKNILNEDNVTKTIAELETNRSRLYNEIMRSIDETVLLLENTEDAKAKLGVNFMHELKNQMTSIKDSTSSKNNDTKAQRRSFPDRKIKLTYEEIASIFKGTNKTLLQKMTEKFDDAEMKKKIDEWIQKKQEEKQKISDYKKRIKAEGKLEKCPRLGLDRRKLAAGGAARRRYRPCCRKCCKLSYMGCL